MVDYEQWGRTDGDWIRPAVLEQLSEEEVLTLVDPRARAALRYLSERSTATLPELGDVVTGFEAAATGSLTGPDRRESNLVVLHHKTLPRLAACGFVEYDTTENEVTATDTPPVVSELLDRAD